MKNKRILATVAALTLIVGGAATASEIYKWTDDEGNLHYGDRPSGAATEERLALSYNRTNNGAVQQRVQTRADTQAERQKARAARDEAEEAAAKEVAEAAERQQKCDTYRARLETFVQSRRLYREDADGERVYLDEQETQDARQRVEDLIAEHCGS